MQIAMRMENSLAQWSNDVRPGKFRMEHDGRDLGQLPEQDSRSLHDPTLALVMALRGLETCCFGGLAIFWLLVSILLGGNPKLVTAHIAAKDQFRGQTNSSRKNHWFGAAITARFTHGDIPVYRRNA
jgi:hypothetical protein